MGSRMTHRLAFESEGGEVGQRGSETPPPSRVWMRGRAARVVVGAREVKEGGGGSFRPSVSRLDAREGEVDGWERLGAEWTLRLAFASGGGQSWGVVSVVGMYRVGWV